MHRVDLLLAWPLPGARPLGARLVASYDHPDRRYHDGRHLGEVLDRVHELSAHGVEFDRMAVLLAAWFHDSVYDGERDAEERSAAWAEDGLAGVVDDGVAGEVARLVRLTETHHPDDDDANGCALSDADLAILAAGPERYAEYRAAVREEYGHLDDQTFRSGRTHVLRHLLGKETLFHTAYAREAWETIARANLEGELLELAEGLQ
jgi:predicted metal-dependent HD superfamily phosphohydrolase